MRYMKNGSKKRSLMVSGLSLFLIVCLLAATTFAWFTTVVNSKDNIIQAGNLKIQVTGYDSLDLGGSLTYNASTGHDLSNPPPLIQENNWKPGDVGTKYVEITNNGTLPLQYKLYISLAGEDLGQATLADVMKFKATPLAGEPDQVTGDGSAPIDWTAEMALASYERAGNQYTLNGTEPLNPAESAWYRIDYMFCPGAGNTYQGMALNADLMVGAIQYENGAAPALSDLVFVSTPEQLEAAIAGNTFTTIVFLNDIEISGDLVIDKDHNFDLNGHTLTITGGRVVIQNITTACAMDIAGGSIVAADTILIQDCENLVVNLGNTPDGPLSLTPGTDPVYTISGGDNVVVHDNTAKVNSTSFDFRDGNKAPYWQYRDGTPVTGVGLLMARDPNTAPPGNNGPHFPLNQVFDSMPFTCEMTMQLNPMTPQGSFEVHYGLLDTNGQPLTDPAGDIASPYFIVYLQASNVRIVAGGDYASGFTMAPFIFTGGECTLGVRVYENGGNLWADMYVENAGTVTSLGSSQIFNYNSSYNWVPISYSNIAGPDAVYLNNFNSADPTFNVETLSISEN